MSQIIAWNPHAGSCWFPRLETRGRSMFSVSFFAINSANWRSSSWQDQYHPFKLKSKSFFLCLQTSCMPFYLMALLWSRSFCCCVRLFDILNRCVCLEPFFATTARQTEDNHSRRILPHVLETFPPLVFFPFIWIGFYFIDQKSKLKTWPVGVN